MRFLSAAVLLSLVAGCGAPATGDTKPAAGAESAAPEVKLQILDRAGIEGLIDSHRGKVVVMDAWSTACPPCLKEFPHLVELHHKHGADNVACISLSFDYEGIGEPEEQQDKVLGFLRQQGAAFDNVLSSDESDLLYKKFNLVSVPAVFVYDREGRLRKRFDNEDSGAEPFTYEDVNKLVESLLVE